MVTRGGEVLGEVSPRRGISFGAIRRDVTGLTWFARFLETGRPDAGDASMITRAVLEGYLAHLGAKGPARTRASVTSRLSGASSKLPDDGTFLSTSLPMRASTTTTYRAVRPVFLDLSPKT